MRRTISYFSFLLTFIFSFVFSFVVTSRSLRAQGSQDHLAQTKLRPEVLQSSTNVDLLETSEDREATGSAILLEVEEPTPSSRSDLTKAKTETVEPLVELLNKQSIGPFLSNPMKHAIRTSVEVGVPVNTIVLLLLIPAVTALIAAARHLVGLRGFGIFLPAVLSVVFVAIGPVVGLGLFLVIVVVSTAVRIILRRSRIKLQYLPRMSLVLLFSVMGILLVLFLAPVIRAPYITNVSIFPVLILVLLAEEFSKVQLGKSARTAVNLTIETLILALVSYVFLTLKPVQEFALLNPEIFVLIVAGVDYLMGKYVGLRFLEYWRFRKIITG